MDKAARPRRIPSDESAADEQQQPRLAKERRHGVVFVHGIGTQRKSDALLENGNPLLEWLAEWYRAYEWPPPDGGVTLPAVEDVELGFGPVDLGDTDRPARAAIRLPHRGEWFWAEAWWAGSSYRPDFWRTAIWAMRYYLHQVWHLTRTAGSRGRYLIAPPRREEDHSTPSPLARFVDLANTLGLLILYGIGAILGLPVLFALVVLAQVPVKAIQDFVILHLLRLFVGNIGEVFLLLNDELQSANIRRRIADEVTWLTEEQHCDEVTVMAHSGGAIAAFQMLTDPAHARAAKRVRKLLTFGSGLNPAWRIKPEHPLLQGPLPEHIQWVDFWGSYDPVPGGWAEPPKDHGKYRCIYTPNEQVQKCQFLVRRSDPNPETAGDGAGQFWPVSLQVTNYMNILTDHGGYWANDEQFFARVAAEIDATSYIDSPFWRGHTSLDHNCHTPKRTHAMLDVITRRRERVSWLALFRGLVLVSAGYVVLRFWSALGLWAAFTRPPGEVWTASYRPYVERDGLLQVLATLLAAAHGVAARVPGLAAAVDPLLELPYWVTGAALIVLLSIVLFLGTVGAGWDAWDRAARKDAIHVIARADT